MSEMELLSKITIGGQELKNRIMLSPMTRARCTPTEDPFDITCTLPNEIMKEYYTQRASCGIVLTEATAISEEGSGWKNAAHMTSEKHAESWKDVVDSVHAANGIIYLQLWHMGRQSHSSHHPTSKRIVSASAIPMTGKVKTIDSQEAEPEVPHALTVDEIKTTVQDYVNAAKLAKQAGFDGVELHGANGYLIDQFLQSSSNVRTDEYGGSVENRARLLVEIIDAIVAAGDYPINRIALRLSPNGSFGGMGSDDNFATFTGLAKILADKFPDLAFLDLMDGKGFGYHGKDKVVTPMDLKAAGFKTPIFCNIGLTKDMAEGMVRSGACEGAVFGRLYISNPDLPERFANNYPLEDPAPYETWWKPTGAKGYTDWPVYKP